VIQTLLKTKTYRYCWKTFWFFAVYLTVWQNNSTGISNSTETKSNQNMIDSLEQNGSLYSS